MKCPLCNWDVIGGACTNVTSHCDYTGPGVVVDSSDINMDNFGSLGDPHNGAGCYDNDMDMS